MTLEYSGYRSGANSTNLTYRREDIVPFVDDPNDVNKKKYECMQDPEENMYKSKDEKSSTTTIFARSIQQSSDILVHWYLVCGIVILSVSNMYRRFYIPTSKEYLKIHPWSV